MKERTCIDMFLRHRSATLQYI